jgi:hypothetical protein
VYAKTIDTGVRALVSEAKVRFPGWELQPREHQIIDAHIAGLIKTNELRTHRFAKALPSLQLQSAIIIARRALARAAEEPRPFDAVANQILILSLLVSTALRAGGLGWLPEDGGPDTALQLREIELSLNDGGVSLADVTLWININRYKGNRYAHKKKANRLCYALLTVK